MVQNRGGIPAECAKSKFFCDIVTQTISFSRGAQRKASTSAETKAQSARRCKSEQIKAALHHAKASEATRCGAKRSRTQSNVNMQCNMQSEQGGAKRSEAKQTKAKKYWSKYQALPILQCFSLVPMGHVWQVAFAPFSKSCSPSCPRATTAGLRSPFNCLAFGWILGILSLGARA